MVDHVARVLCRASSSENQPSRIYCPVCDHLDEATGRVTLGDCSLWPAFRREAATAIAGVRDYARLDRRTKPRPRKAVEIVAEVGAT